MKKILFNDRYGLTQAVIEGRKTMTRRMVPWGLTEQWMEFVSDAPNVGGVYVHESEKDFYEKEAPRYKVGEVVAVAQSYEQVYLQGHMSGDDAIIKGLKYDPGMCNKMYVRANLMPHRIRITGVRCERLQDISDEDCLKEGINASNSHEIGYGIPWVYEFAGSKMAYYTPRDAFASLIDRVSGRETWDLNPWVVVYEFELVK